MNKYLTIFESHSQYVEPEVRPNVSYCIQEDEVHYNPSPFNGHAYVDLGLPSGTLWATMNVGANNPTDYGLYFQWGDTQGYTAGQVGSGEGKKAFSWADYKWTEDGGSTMSKYNATDGKTVLDLEDDAASVNMGGDWHMPNVAQCNELLKETKNGFVTGEGAFTQFAWNDSDLFSSPTETTATISGWNIPGCLFFKNTYDSVTDAIDAKDYLFIPTAGSYGSEIHNATGFGHVWTSDLNPVNSLKALELDFIAFGASVMGGFGRYSGLSVRGVVGEAPKLISHTWYEDHLEIVLSKSATNVKLIYLRVQGHDPAPEELTLTSSDGITWITSELSNLYRHCADMTVVANGIAIGSWSERNGCLT